MMKYGIVRQYLVKVNLLVLVVAFGFFVFGKEESARAVSHSQIAAGLSAAGGVALDESNRHLYFVEYSAGTLGRSALAI